MVLLCNLFLLHPACASWYKLQLQDRTLIFYKTPPTSGSQEAGVLQTNQPESADDVLKLMTRIISASQDV